MQPKCRVITVLAVLAVCLSVIGISSLNAQTSKGILAGTVRDNTGAVISHAKITIVSQLTGETRDTTTNSEGAYRVEAVNPSVYSLHVEASGFAGLDIKDLHVLPSVVTSYDALLSAGRITQRHSHTIQPNRFRQSYGARTPAPKTPPDPRREAVNPNLNSGNSPRWKLPCPRETPEQFTYLT